MKFNSCGDTRLGRQQSATTPLQDVPLIIIMSALSKLGLGDYPGDTNLYDWFLSMFKSNNFGSEIVTYGLVTELKGYLHLKKSRHDAETPPNALSRQQLCHLIIYLVVHIPIDKVTKNFENGLFKRLGEKAKESHEPDELWAYGIDYIKKQSLGIIGDNAAQGDVDGDGEHEHVGGAERGDEGGEVDKTPEALCICCICVFVYLGIYLFVFLYLRV